MNTNSPQKKPIEQAGMLTLAVALAVVGYGVWAFWGPYRWIAELQLALFGSYEITITFLLALLLVVLALLPIQLLCKRMQSEVQVSKKPTPKKWKEFEVFVNTRAGHLVLGGLGCIGFGVYNYAVAYSLGDLVAVDAATLEAHSAPLPSSRWWKLDGVLVPEEGQSWEEHHAKNYYIPLISHNWKTGQPVAVVARIEQYQYKKLKSRGGVFEGTAHPAGMPGDVLRYWQKNGSGSLKIPDDVLLFDVGDGPTKRESMAFFFSCFGFGMSLLGAIIHQFKKTRNTPDPTKAQPSGERFNSAQSK